MSYKQDSTLRKSCEIGLLFFTLASTNFTFAQSPGGILWTDKLSCESQHTMIDEDKKEVVMKGAPKMSFVISRTFDLRSKSVELNLSFDGEVIILGKPFKSQRQTSFEFNLPGGIDPINNYSFEHNDEGVVAKTSKEDYALAVPMRTLRLKFLAHKSREHGTRYGLLKIVMGHANYYRVAAFGELTFSDVDGNNKVAPDMGSSVTLSCIQFREI